jgi:hypothetical protein
MIERICEEIIVGKSLRQICAAEGMPCFEVVARWLAKNGPEYDLFRARYAAAKAVQADIFADAICELAETIEPKVRECGDRKLANALVNAIRAEIDAKKWVAAKLLPKKYGDRVALTGGDGEGPMEVVVKRVGGEQSGEQSA